MGGLPLAQQLAGALKFKIVQRVQHRLQLGLGHGLLQLGQCMLGPFSTLQSLADIGHQGLQVLGRQGRWRCKQRLGLRAQMGLGMLLCGTLRGIECLGQCLHAGLHRRGLLGLGSAFQLDQ